MARGAIYMKSVFDSMMEDFSYKIIGRPFETPLCGLTFTSNVASSTGWYIPSTGESYTTTINPNSSDWGKEKYDKFNKKPCAYCGCKTHIEDVHCCGCGAPVE